MRTAFLSAAALLLGACASVPVGTPEDVAVRTNMVTPRYSSINARVLNDASVLDYSFAASLEQQADTLTRLESRYTHQLGDRETVRVRVGDTVSTSGMWGSSVRYGGVQFGTRFDPRDDVVVSNRLAASGLAVLPTVADAMFASVRSTDTLLSQQALSVDRSFTVGGANTLSFVTRDAMGRSDTFTAPIVEGTRLAEPGCNDFSVGFGKVRRDYAVSSNDYGPTFANATVTCGGPLGFTIESHGEYLADEVAAVGVGLARRLGSLGTASLAIASSRADIGTGWLARVGFEHENPLFNFKVRSLMQSRDFRELGSAWSEDPVVQRDLASLGMKISEQSSVALAYATQVTWQKERINLIALNQSTRLGLGSLSMSAGHSLEENFGSSVFISYRRPFAVSARPARGSDIDEISPLFGPGPGAGVGVQQ